MQNSPIKYLLAALAVGFPFLLLLWFTLLPYTDGSAPLPMFHFYIVTFTTFSAAVVSILLSLALREIAQPRHYLAAVAFAVMGAVFFTHGLATPGALIAYLHPAVGWSAWLTLFSGGAMFALAALDNPARSRISPPVERITKLATAVTLFYFAVAFFAPQALEWINANTNPWHTLLIFFATLLLWLFAALKFTQIWHQTHSRVDGVLLFVAFWMAAAAASMHLFAVWQYSWWLYHFILLIGFLVTVYTLLLEYEQARQFRLLRYYLAISLIVTVLAALIASYLFADFSRRTLVAQKENAAVSQLTLVTTATRQTLLPDATSAQALATYAADLPTYPLGAVTVYDVAGQPVEALAAAPLPAAEIRSGFEQALAGRPTAQFRTAEIISYMPLYTAAGAAEPPIGVAVALQADSSLTEAILQARRAGLLITALSMGLLFMVLLLVVARADRLIAARTAELAHAYEELRQAEAMRDDLTSMIVHDLQNPLTTIYGSLGLVRHLKGPEHAENRRNYIGQALRASERMTGLIEDILAVSKIEAGRMEPHLQPTQVTPLLAERLDSFTAHAQAEDKQLTLDSPQDLQAALDAKMIGRVVDNLVSNALKYTHTSVQVRAWSEQRNGSRQLMICVRDDGQGIPDDYKQHIFNKFAQAPNGDSQPARKGTGLGLTFCGLAVEVHGGKIWVDDAPGGGSDFMFALPQNPAAG